MCAVRLPKILVRVLTIDGFSVGAVFILRNMCTLNSSCCQ